MRDIRIKDTLYCGNLSNPRISKRDFGANERVSVRLKQHSYNAMAVFAYALDVTPSRMCAILLNESMSDYNFINTYVDKFLARNLTPYQLREMKAILRSINNKVDDKMTSASLLSVIVDETKSPSAKIEDTVGDFIINYWRDNKWKKIPQSIIKRRGVFYDYNYN